MNTKQMTEDEYNNTPRSDIIEAELIEYLKQYEEFTKTETYKELVKVFNE